MNESIRNPKQQSRRRHAAAEQNTPTKFSFGVRSSVVEALFHKCAFLRMIMMMMLMFICGCVSRTGGGGGGSSSSVLWAAMARRITRCSSSVYFVSGDTIELEDCVNSTRLIVSASVAGQPCENISIQLYRFTELQGIDWSSCTTTLRNINLTVQDSMVLYGGLLSRWRDLRRVSEVTIDLQRNTFDITMPSSTATGTPRVVALILKNETDTWMANVQLRVVSCIARTTKLTKEDHSYFFVLTGTMGVASNLSVDIENVTLTVADPQIPSTSARFVWLLFRQTSTVRVSVTHCRFVVDLPKSLLDFSVIRIQGGGDARPEWRGLSLTVRDVSFLANVSTLSAAKSESIRLVSLGSPTGLTTQYVHLAMRIQRVQATIITGVQSSRILSSEPLVASDVVLEDIRLSCLASRFSNNAQIAYLQSLLRGTVFTMRRVALDATATVNLTLTAVQSYHVQLGRADIVSESTFAVSDSTLTLRYETIGSSPSLFGL